MANFTIETTNMSPGDSYDCHILQCLPFVGGVCAFVPDSSMWWCCAPHNPYCWSPAQECNPGATDPVSEQVLCTATNRPDWCCSSRYERCPPDGAGSVCTPRCPTANTGTVCTPEGYANPARGGPAWGPAAATASAIRIVPSASEMPLTTAYAPAPAVRSVNLFALAAGVAVALALAGAAAYFLWRRRYPVRPAKASVGGGGERCAEVSVETGRHEMHEEPVRAAMHEVEAPARYEMDARVEVEIAA